MLSRFHISVVILLVSINGYTQALPDSIINLKMVEVKARQSLNPEDAGMKTTRVDTLILMEKINASLSELLSENTPVFIKNHGRGALASASFRGTAASHTQVNWNGMYINSPMAGMVDFSLIPVYLIDEMNLKHGAASIADQGGGLGGSININNNVDWDNAFNLKYMQGIGSYRTFEEFLKFGIGNDKIQSKTRIYHNYSQNGYTFINRGIGNIDPETGEIINPVDTNRNADYTLYGILQEVYYKHDLKNIFSAKWWWQKAKRTIPRATSYEGPENANLNRQNDNDHKIVLDWKHTGKSDRLLILTGYINRKLEYTLENNIPGSGKAPVIYSDSREQSSINTISYTYSFTNGFSIENKIDLNYHDVVTRDTVRKTGYHKDRSDISWLLSARKNFLGRINLNLMLRQQWVDFNYTPPIPYFGFDIKILREEDLILRGNIARNYHHPTLNDLYWQPGGNPDLKVEEGFSYEMGLAYREAIYDHIFKAELSWFYSDIDNWIIWIPSHKGYWEPHNIQRVVSKGVELVIGLNGSFGKLEYHIAGNYAYTSSVNRGDPIVWGDESTGKQLPYIPLHSGNLMVNLSYKGFYVTYQHNSYSERFTTSSNDITDRDWLYPYYMNDLVLGKELKLKKTTMTAEFKIYNLFNETYHSVLYRPMPGRNFMVLFMINI